MHQLTEPEPAHSLQASSPWGAPGESPPLRAAPCGAAQVHSGVLGAAGGSGLAGCRAPHPDWLSWLPRRRGSPESAAGAPARCCCGSSRLRRVLPAKYLVVFSQLEEMCIALAGRTFAAKALCVCVEGRRSTSHALGKGMHGAGNPGVLLHAGRGCRVLQHGITMQGCLPPMCLQPASWGG